MERLNDKELKSVLGGKKKPKFNAGKCFVGTAGGALAGARGLGKFGWQGAVAGAVLSGGLGAWNNCKG